MQGHVSRKCLRNLVLMSPPFRFQRASPICPLPARSWSSPAIGSSEWISSYDGIWGSWHSPADCPGLGNDLTGARIRLEGSQGSGDDTAANNVELACRNGGTIAAPGGHSRGSWRTWSMCPNNTAICGICYNENNCYEDCGPEYPGCGGPRVVACE